MRQRTLLIGLAALLPLAFVAGRFAGRTPAGAGGSGKRQALYWVDPMNPSFRSPAPGTAPCGMPLEPVFSDGPSPGSAPPGAVPVRADRLQLIGVVRETVSPRVLRHTLRLVGSIAPDETRLFRITAATGGRIREMGPAATGTLVAKGEVLGAYYTQEVSVPQQNYIRLLQTYQSLKTNGSNPYDNLQGGGQLATYERNLHTTRQLLVNLGMSDEQIEEIGRHGQAASLVQIRAPAAGFITTRNVSLGQSVDVGDELYAIADLARVWILADAFEGQERFFRPGMRATASLPGDERALTAEVSDVLPRFDPATRTLKIRLTAANPGFTLRPGVFVDVELPVEVGPGIFLPKEAVLDSGTRKTVFVEQEPGVFVPREVRTGRRLGELVEIVAGLMAGETAVTSGNFLLDSESRMRTAGPPAAADTTIDPICGMKVQEAAARSRGLVSEHGGSVWFFCAPGCKRAFDRDPRAAAGKASGSRERATAPPHEIGHGTVHDRVPGGLPEHAPRELHAAGRMEDARFKRDWAARGKLMPVPVDPVCGMEVNEARALAAGLVSEHGGKSWFFCAPECRQEFEKDPGTYVQTSR